MRVNEAREGMACYQCGAPMQSEALRCSQCGVTLAPSQLPSEHTPEERWSGFLDDRRALPLPRAQPSASQPRDARSLASASRFEWGEQPSPTGGYALPLESETPLRVSPRRSPGGGKPVISAQLKPRRRRWRLPALLLLTLLLVGGIVSGSWLFWLRPIVHHAVEQQIRQGLQRAIEDLPKVPTATPPGVPVPLTEATLNHYISQHADQLSPITDMHVSLQPGIMVISFQTFGFGSTIRLGLGVVKGQPVVQNVEVSGLLWWVESATELTPPLDTALSQVPGKVGRSLASVRIEQGTVQLEFR